VNGQDTQEAAFGDAIEISTPRFVRLFVDSVLLISRSRHGRAHNNDWQQNQEMSDGSEVLHMR